MVAVPDDEKAKTTTDDDVTVEEEAKDGEPKMKQAIKSDWMHINTKGPVWARCAHPPSICVGKALTRGCRDPKDVTDEEYNALYSTLTTTQDSPTGWVHFKGDAGRTSFHALIYMPTILPQDFYAKSYQQTEAVRLYVRRVLITKEPAPDFLPKWLNWIKVVIDADDLPLNVGRDSLQTSRSLRQIQSSIIKKLLDHLGAMAEKEPEKYAGLWKTIGVPMKVGSVEDKKNRDRINKLLRFTSSVSDQASLEGYVARRKKGQKQIFFMAGAGLDPKDLAKSPFVEKLVARGYEVLYLTDPMDEMITSSLGNYEGMKFQDVAKKGLSMGDEEELQKDKEELEAFKEQYEPLTSWIKKEFDHSVSEGPSSPLCSCLSRS